MVDVRGGADGVGRGELRGASRQEGCRGDEGHVGWGLRCDGGEGVAQVAGFMGDDVGEVVVACGEGGREDVLAVRWMATR